MTDKDAQSPFLAILSEIMVHGEYQSIPIGIMPVTEPALDDSCRMLLKCGFTNSQLETLLAQPLPNDLTPSFVITREWLVPDSVEVNVD